MKKYKNILRKEEEAMILTDLPPEIIYEILVKVPPHYLQQLRLVCKSWKNMFTTNNFILDNFNNNMKADFLVQRESTIWRREKVYRMEIDEKELNYKLHEIKLSRGRTEGKLISSCCGVFLRKALVKNKKNVLKVLNSVTRRCLTLPECPSGCEHKYDCGSALGFDPCKNVFKVVHIIYNDGFGFEIFTIGDSWKQILGPWEDWSVQPQQGLAPGVCINPVCINNGRFLHWNVFSSEFVLSVDVCHEKIIKLQHPNIGKTIKTCFYHLLELGGNLSWAYCKSSTRIDIWILEDFSSNLWLKKHFIKAEMIDYLVPTSKNKLPDFLGLNLLAATSSNGVLVFENDDDWRLYFYDIEKKRMKKCKSGVDILIVHRSSLFKLQQS